MANPRTESKKLSGLYYDRVVGLPARGQVTFQVTQWLRSPDEEIRPGTEGTPLFKLKQCLAYLGYLEPSLVDECWNAETEAAIKQFQKNSRLTQDAWYGKGSRSALRLAMGEEVHDAASPEPKEPTKESPTPKAPPETPRPVWFDTAVGWWNAGVNWLNEQAANQAADAGGVTGGLGNTTGSDSYVFKEAFEIVDSMAYRRDPKTKEILKNAPIIPNGTFVHVVKASTNRVQIVTVPGAPNPIKASDNVWTAFSNLGGRGLNVPLGDESTAAGKKAADAIRARLPAGRKPGNSGRIWKFKPGFRPEWDGGHLNKSLMTKVWNLMQWVVYNDMTTADILIGDGMRSPFEANSWCVAWYLLHAPSKNIVTLDTLKALDGGKDIAGNVWYKPGWTLEDAKKVARTIRTSSAQAAAGYPRGDKRRAPLKINEGMGQSRHCTGNAIDVTINWRKEGVNASKNTAHTWGWKDIYTRFGLHRPVSNEHWHTEELS